MNSPRRRRVVVHVVEATATGTLSMVSLAADCAVTSMGAEVHVIHARRPETPQRLSGHFDPRVQLHELAMSGAHALSAVVRLRRLLHALQPDIVHLHSSIAGFLGRLAGAFHLPSARFFYSPHCISVMRRDIGAKAYLFAALERLAGVRACTYVACSESERQAVRRWVGAEARLLENAVDAALLPLPTTAAKASPGTVRVVTVGGIRPQKDPAMYAAICRGVHARDPSVEFVWIGDGDTACVQVLRQSGVVVTGWKDRADIAAELGNALVYLSTARWEGMPVAVIEAMLAGTPVLARRCAGNVDVIEAGINGQAFDHCEEAVAHVLDCVRDPAPTRAMAMRARPLAQDRFCPDRYARELAALYAITPPSGCGA